MVGRRFRRSTSGRPSIERRAICALLIIAWAWILGFLGVVVWHLQKASDSSEPLQAQPPSQPISPILPQRPNLDSVAMSTPSTPKDPHSLESPLLIFTCHRAKYLSETLDDIFKSIPRPCRFGCPIVVSEDGQHGDVQKVVLDYKAKFEAEGIPFFHIQHKQKLSDSSSTAAYESLAKHYGWALRQLFQRKIDPMMPIPQRVVILEEDIHTSPDFFSYMEATSRILDQDPSLFAVSAFSDNGHMVKDSGRLLRSDFFPGLGWMINRKLWINELEPKWPAGYWDDWLREPAQRKGRQIIRPEISRTYHFGSKGGASSNQFGSILERVKLNQDPIDWSSKDLSYLRDNVFERQYGKLLQGSKKVASISEAQLAAKTGNTWLEYTDFPDFKSKARKLQIMDDEKAMIPRTAYKGIVEIRPYGEFLLFLTPPIQELRQNMRGLS